MQYHHITAARFHSRPNRFIALVTLDDGTEVRAHVKNTGRCAELLVPGAVVYLEYVQNPNRTTPCDLVAVEKQTADGPVLVNMDSIAPNQAAFEWLSSGGLGYLERLRAEYRLGDSRFDFYATGPERPVLIEVKGCTLEQNGIARFPDAPTERGLKHFRDLTGYAQKGWRCCVLFVVQMKGARRFCPNWSTHAAFGHALREASQAGVEVFAVDCLVTPTEMRIDQFLPVDLTVPE